ncbi:MAG: hypothetical protein Q7U57_15850 [Methylovulum sp.]|jgi:hypothetical protein|nr:hypothetical protein [Methylovulum sp.]
MRTLFIVILLLATVGTALSAGKQAFDTTRQLAQQRHAQIAALTANP